MTREWTRHEMTTPPEDPEARQAWCFDAIWILFERDKDWLAHGCPAHAQIMERLGRAECGLRSAGTVIRKGRSLWDQSSGYIKGVLATVVLLYFVTKFIGMVLGLFNFLHGG